MRAVQAEAFPVRVLVLASLLALTVGCAGGDARLPEYPEIDPRTACEGRLEPVQARGQVEVVGTDASVLNCTFEGNATAGNAGALWAGNGRVHVRHSTFAHNTADYAPAIFKGASGEVTLTGVVMAHNGTDNQFSALACHETFGDGGGNVQWPDVRNSGSADTPCASSVLFADPRLEALGDHGGPTHTMPLPADSPAAGAVEQGCPMFDQRGELRADPCAAGAFEPVI
jgi:hypothetical protein